MFLRLPGGTARVPDKGHGLDWVFPYTVFHMESTKCCVVGVYGSAEQFSILCLVWGAGMSSIDWIMIPWGTPLVEFEMYND